MNTRSATTPLLVVVALGATAGSAQAASIPVTGGATTWSQANVYGATPVPPATPVRTFLGHVTRPVGPGGFRGESAGTANVSNGATATDSTGAAISEVSPASLRGEDVFYRFGFPVSSGAVDTEAKILDVETTGTLSYTQFPSLPGAAPVITINNLHIVVKGGSGAVYASGTTTTPAAPNFDRTTPLFTLDSAAASFTTDASGAVTVSGLVPTLGTAGVFGANATYPVGIAGPDRTPNTFGTFSVTVNPLADYPAKPISDPGPAAPVVTAPLTPSAPPLSLVSSTLTKSAFDAKRGIIVKVRPRGSFASLGEGTVKGKVLTMKTPDGAHLAGKYVLSRISASTKLPKSVVVTVATK